MRRVGCGEPVRFDNAQCVTIKSRPKALAAQGRSAALPQQRGRGRTRIAQTKKWMRSWPHCGVVEDQHALATPVVSAVMELRRVASKAQRSAVLECRREQICCFKTIAGCNDARLTARLVLYVDGSVLQHAATSDSVHGDQNGSESVGIDQGSWPVTWSGMSE